MPAISTMVYPAPAYVRVEVNWADVGQAVAAAVYRVDCLTGQRLPLRPYVSFNGDFLTLSCGYGIFWDTEPQLDRCVYYCTQAIDVNGNVATQPAPIPFTYTFSTPIVDGWGPTDTGQAVTNTGGTVPGDYDVAAGVGTQSNGTVNAFRQSFADTGLLNQDITADTMLTIGTAVGASVTTWITGRFTNTANYYLLRQTLTTTGTVTIDAGKRSAGSLIILTGATTIDPAHVGGTWYRNRFQVWGNRLRAKVWKRTDPEPVDWQIDVTDTVLPLLTTGTSSGLLSRLEAGNGNGLPVVFNWDNWTVTDPCVELVTIETCSDDVVVPSSGEFRLGDPMRPCNDVTLQLTPQADPACVPTQGIFFGNMDDEEAEANSGTFAPVNSVYPIGVYRNRRSLASTLTVLSRTFADRDALRQLNAPGGPLMLRSPAQYGTGDRYLLAGTVTEHRGVSDHRVQPRAVQMPHVVLAYPYGPSQGVCGTRVADLCDIYPTWDAITAAGLTWADLLRGKASHDTPIPDTVERTWADVNSTYANWTAVNAGNTDWDDLLDGA